MSAEDLSTWLSGRKPAAPAALAVRLADAVGNEAGAPPSTLAFLGDHLLGRVAAATTQDRRQALDLLAADALVTYAFEAQAEADVRGLTSLAEKISRESSA
ncbi:MAG TPA: hypothetical protein VEV39_01920 [Gemmatimonadales bacterium]|nr:hypothetical protein [Gemmatimonadales bacterium]